MYKHNFSSRTWLLLAAVLLIAACGGSDDQTTVNESASGPEPETTVKAPVIAKTQSSKSGDWCALIPAEEVAAALGGNLPLGTPRSIKAGCEYPVKFGIDGNNFTYRKLSLGKYDAYKAYEDQSSIAFEYLEGLGQEAFILNDAQVCVLLNDHDAILVTAQVIAFGEELPISQEKLRAGLIEIAGKVITKL